MVRISLEPHMVIRALSYLILPIFFAVFSADAQRVVVSESNQYQFSAARTGKALTTLSYRDTSGESRLAFTKKKTISLGTKLKVVDGATQIAKIKKRVRKFKGTAKGKKFKRQLKDLKKGEKARKRLLANHTLGVNLDPFGYNSVIPFKDLFMISADWTVKEEDADDPSGEEVPMQANGYPSVDIPHDPGDSTRQILATTFFFNQPGIFPNGDYTLIFEGQGNIRMFGASGFREFTEGGSYTVAIDNTSTEGINFEIRESDADNNPIRNIRFITPENLATYETQPFYPRFLQNLSGFNVIRFMQATNTNGGEYPCDDEVDATSGDCVKTWANRKLTSHRSQASARGVAWEYVIDICNAVSAGCWINIPHGADDDYIRELATLVRSRLRSDLKVYPELSNEIFNTEQAPHPITSILEYKYPQSQWASARGMALGLSGDAQTARIRYTALRTAQMLEIFEEVFAEEASSRLVKFLPTWILPSYNERLLEAFHTSAYNPNGITVSSVAVGAYIGFTILEELLTEGMENSATTDDILDLLEDEILNNRADPLEPGSEIESFRSILAEINADLAQYSLGLISYEGGQHVAAITESETLGNLAMEAQRETRMGTIYDQLFAEWVAQNGGVFMQYSLTVVPDEAGSFGALEYTDQDPGTPKMEALRRKLRNDGYLLTLAE